MPKSTQSELQPLPSQSSFEDLVTGALGDLQVATGTLIEQLPETIRRAVDLERTLQVDRKLAWQIFRLSRSSGLGELENVPTRAPVQRVIEAARALGVQDET